MTPSPDTDPSATYRYDREVLFNKACAAMFALEATLPNDSEQRRSLFRARLDFVGAWNSMDPVAKASKYPPAEWDGYRG